MTMVKRFAFYGRVSTEDQQDPTSSRNWQLARSRQVIEPAGGEIVAEFFDVGQSRSLPWKRRPEARAAPRVVPRPEPRVRRGGHRRTATRVLRQPVRAHLPGVHSLRRRSSGYRRSAARSIPGSEAHDLVMSLYGGMSKGERMRIKTRVRSAMAARPRSRDVSSAGGRPTATSSSTPARTRTRAKAALGQQLRRLAPDPVAAPVVQRIFEEYCARRRASQHRLGSHRDGIPSPSAHDPARNRHRSDGQGKWAKSAVRAILANPRYTGFEVWNKQRKDEILIDVDDVALGHVTKMRWNDNARVDLVRTSPRTRRSSPTSCSRPPRPCSEANKRPDPAAHRSRTATTCSAGRLRCGVCERRMQGHWNHGQAYYRCKFRSDYPDGKLRAPQEHLRQRRRRGARPRRLARVTLRRRPPRRHLHPLAGVSEPDPDAEDTRGRLRDAIADCDRKLDHYRALLDHDDAVTVAANWIAETRTRTPSPRSATRPPSPRRQAHHRTGQGTRHRATRTSSTCSPTPTPRTRPSSTTSSASR